VSLEDLVPAAEILEAVHPEFHQFLQEVVANSSGLEKFRMV
jgi:hypothetical protein